MTGTQATQEDDAVRMEKRRNDTKLLSLQGKRVDQNSRLCREKRNLFKQSSFKKRTEPPHSKPVWALHTLERGIETVIWSML